MRGADDRRLTDRPWVTGNPKSMALWVLLCGFLVSLPAHAWSPMVDRDRVQSERFQRWVAKQKGPVERDSYLTTAGVFQAASGLNRARSGVVQPMLIGHSVERRPIWAFRVRRPDEEVHTKILVFAGIHALEGSQPRPRRGIECAGARAAPGCRGRGVAAESGRPRAG